MSDDPGVYFYYTAENLSPRITPEFLRRQAAILLPGQFRREHQNQWDDAADSLTTTADVDAAMANAEPTPPRGLDGLHYAYFLDLGHIHDPSVIGRGYLRGDVVIIDKLITFQGSKAEPVQLPVVEHVLLAETQAFPPWLIKVETWQGLSTVQRLTSLRLPIELYTPTAKTNAEEWPLLVQRLSQRTIVLPQHERLRAELLNLTYEMGPTGIRVIDKGKIHQDHAVVVRGLVAMLQPWCDPVPSYEITDHERAEMNGFAAWAGAPAPDEIQPDYDNADEVRDPRWYRTGPTGARSYLW